jgi:tetratricopeptide (TPR) repeat protein
VDALFQKMSETDPSLAQLVAAPDKSAQRDIIAALDWYSRRRSLMSIMVLGFHLQKVARHDEALALQDIAPEIIGQEPAERTQSFFDRTRPRLMGDELKAIGRIHAEKGELTAALAAYQQADRCFEEDAALRARYGITKTTEADRLFHQQDFRSQLFTTMADVYRRLGDESMATEFIHKAWQHSQLTMQPEDRAVDLRSRAQAARGQGELDTALGYYWEMLDVALANRHSQIVSRDVALALTGAAEIYASLGLHRRALELYSRSLELNKLANNRERMLDDYRGIGDSHAARGDVDKALATYTDALICCSTVLPGDASGPSGLRRAARGKARSARSAAGAIGDPAHYGAAYRPARPQPYDRKFDYAAQRCLRRIRPPLDGARWNPISVRSAAASLGNPAQHGAADRASRPQCSDPLPRVCGGGQ